MTKEQWKNENRNLRRETRKAAHWQLRKDVWAMFHQIHKEIEPKMAALHIVRDEIIYAD